MDLETFAGFCIRRTVFLAIQHCILIQTSASPLMVAPRCDMVKVLTCVHGWTVVSPKRPELDFIDMD